MLNSPVALLSAARIFALTTSAIKEKSLVCLPSPKIIGGMSAKMLEINFGITAADA